MWLGMYQYADGGFMASKPYATSGKYIQRMSNYCSACPCKPQKKTGEDTCPFNTLYWDFLIRHEKTLGRNPRMQFQVRNLSRKTAAERRAIRKCGDALRSRLA